MITIFTDGSSRGNPGPGGWGTVLVDAENEKVIELGGREENTTNNRMELTAAIAGLKKSEGILSADSNTTIYTDSSYLINGITKWVKQWKRVGWVTRAKEDVQNRDLWEKLDEAASHRRIEWKYVGGHVGIAGNERCDAIATGFADGKEVKLFEGNLEDYAIKDILNIDMSALKAETKERSKATAYSYISMVNGKIEIHHSWAECERRVKGVKGARYKKSLNAEDEEKIISEFKEI